MASLATQQQNRRRSTSTQRKVLRMRKRHWTMIWHFPRSLEHKPTCSQKTSRIIHGDNSWKRICGKHGWDTAESGSYEYYHMLFTAPRLSLIRTHSHPTTTTTGPGFVRFQQQKGNIHQEPPKSSSGSSWTLAFSGHPTLIILDRTSPKIALISPLMGTIRTSLSLTSTLGSYGSSYARPRNRHWT